MGKILGDRPFVRIPKIGLSDSFTIEDGGWESYNKFPQQLADVNKDGRADIVGFGAKKVYVSLANPDGTFSSTVVGLSNAYTIEDGGWESYNKFPRQLADVDGDGRADIVGFGARKVYVSLSNGDGTFQSPKVASTSFSGGTQDQFPRLLADVNGDERADVVSIGLDGTLVALGQIDGTFGEAQLATEFVSGGGNADKNPKLLGHVNEDKFADIVTFGSNDVFIYLGKEDGTFEEPKVALSNNFTENGGDWTSYDLYPRQLADVNGDGRSDIIGFSKKDVFVSYANPDGTFGTPQIGLQKNFTIQGGGWTSYDKYPRQVVDVNNDGRADIVGFGERAVYVALATTEVNDVLVGTRNNDRIEGLTGNDEIDGRAGNDFLIGGIGNDSLTGGEGTDRLEGNGGSDRFIFNTNGVFNNATMGVDTITDFTLGTDKIVLDKTTFTALQSAVGSGFNVAGEFATVANSNAAAVSSAKIVYVASVRELVYNQNGSSVGFGSGGRFAKLDFTDELLSPAASDFEIAA